MKQKPKTRLPDFNELTKRISFVDVLNHYNLLLQMDEKGDQLRGVCPIHEGAKNKNSLSEPLTYCKCYGVVPTVAEEEKKTGDTSDPFSRLNCSYNNTIAVGDFCSTISTGPKFSG